MRVNDVFSYAFSAIKLRKLRAGLTTLGVVIGIAAIVALLSITQGLQTTISTQLQTGFATDTLLVSTGRGLWTGPGGGAAADSDFDLLANYTTLIDDIPDVVMSVAVVEKLGYVDSGGRTLLISMVGVNFSKYLNVYSTTFTAESGVIPSDPADGALVVGKRVNDPWKNGTLFCGVNSQVDVIWTDTSNFPFQNVTYSAQVTAVLKEIGGFGIGPSDFSVYIPIQQARTFFGTEECETIIVKLGNDDDETIERVSKAIEELFSGQVTVTSSTAVLDTISSIFSTVELFLAGIAAISLLVAGIGIMNIMIVSLMERTREIGILKALGMKSRTVLTIFLSEAVIIGVLGAVFGIASGWVLANMVTQIFSGGGFLPPGSQAAGGLAITPILTPTVLIGSFAFGLVISTVFASYPAWRASRLKPVEALRYE